VHSPRRQAGFRKRPRWPPAPGDSQARQRTPCLLNAADGHQTVPRTVLPGNHPVKDLDGANRATQWGRLAGGRYRPGAAIVARGPCMYGRQRQVRCSSPASHMQVAPTRNGVPQRGAPQYTCKWFGTAGVGDPHRFASAGAEQGARGPVAPARAVPVEAHRSCGGGFSRSGPVRRRHGHVRVVEPGARILEVTPESPAEELLSSCDGTMRSWHRHGCRPAGASQHSCSVAGESSERPRSGCCRPCSNMTSVPT
jgi:hypothetical protein